jgi:FlaA1/EpsC-like NDP-sugar epimerase
MIRLTCVRTSTSRSELVGLRPSAKLYEELVDENEDRQRAAVEGLSVAGSLSIHREILRGVSDKLAAVVRCRDQEATERLIGFVLPNFDQAGQVAAGSVEPAGGGRRRAPPRPAAVRPA